MRSNPANLKASTLANVPSVEVQATFVFQYPGSPKEFTSAPLDSAASFLFWKMAPAEIARFVFRHVHFRGLEKEFLREFRKLKGSRRVSVSTTLKLVNSFSHALDCSREEARKIVASLNNVDAPSVKRAETRARAKPSRGGDGRPAN